MHPIATASDNRPTSTRWLRRTGWTLALLSVAATQWACSNLSGRVPSAASIATPYKMDLQQGNVVTSEQAKALRPGMSRLQVRDILGSPLLTSVFHADRWDYVFTFKRQGQELQSRRLTAFFKGDVLERFESDPLPSEAEFVASLEVRRQSGKPPVLQATEEQLKAFQASGAAAIAVPASGVAAPVSYPPLEAPGTSR